MVLVFLLLARNAFSEALQVSYPLIKSSVSSQFGERTHPIKKYLQHHEGLDLRAPKGAPIHSISSGRVVFAGRYLGYGNLIVVRHTESLTSHYGHCSKILVKVGDTVHAGTLIGEVGSTGISTGAHLHFELRAQGVALNPLVVLPGLGQEGEG